MSSDPNLFRTCQDGHRCENNALCVEATQAEGSYFCDCSTASGDFVGLSCEFEAETFCRAPQETTAGWFCANQGTCVKGNGAQWKCDCPSEYDGPHCEYIAGALPSDWPGNNAIAQNTSRSSTKEDGVKVGVVVAIVLVSVLVGIMLAFLILRSIRRRTITSDQVDDLKEPTSFRKAGQNAPKDQSEALNIEMDGTGFREAVISSKTNTTEPYDFDSHPDSEMGSPRIRVNLPDSLGAPPRNGARAGSKGGSSRQSNGHGMML